MITLDAARMGSRKEAHRYLQQMLSFPDYYGCNLDALYDCLTDLDETAVTFTGTEEAGDTYFDKVIRVFREAAENNPKLQILNDPE